MEKHSLSHISGQTVLRHHVCVAGHFQIKGCFSSISVWGEPQIANAQRKCAQQNLFYFQLRSLFLQSMPRVSSSPLVMAVSGATVTRPNEPTMVCTISAATYL
mgnify:CR=1 FL=1